MPSVADDLVCQNDLYKTLKNIETILMRIEERFGKYYPIYAESQDAAKRFADAEGLNMKYRSSSERQARLRGK